jgi:hypothetical protein
MATYVKVAGTWREVTSDSPSNGVCGYVKVDGTWRTVNQSYAKINGAWRSTCTAPGQQPAAVPQNICYRPNFCLNGTNGEILPTTEPCYLADGVTVGSRTASYTCQTDPGCITFTVPAGTCTAPDPIIQVVNEEIGDCEFWGGLSGCTSGYAKRVTKKYSDSSIKVSYSCCNPLLPNLKYYCTLRPFTTGVCLNELKDTDITGTIVTGQGEWVCEELGIISFPSCSTTENCTVPKTSVVTSEACGYLGTGQRSVTARTFQSWCTITQDTVIGDCLGADDPCGGKYCGEGSGEEEFPTASCGSGTGIRYKCVTPEGCNVIYNFRRCIAPPPPPPEPTAVVSRYTEICYTTNETSSPPVSCRQFISYTGGGTPGPGFCAIYGTSADQFIPCPAIQGPSDPGGGQVNCPVISTSQQPCTTDDGRIGSYTYQETPIGCEDIYGPCVAVSGSNPCAQILDTFTTECGCPDGINEGTQTIQLTPGDCPNIEGPCIGCPTGGTGPDTGDEPDPVCNGTCVYGSGNQPCGDNGTQSYCITAVGCPDIYGFCNEPADPTTPTEPPVVNPPTDPETPPIVIGCIIFCDGEPLFPAKSVNINTLIRTKAGLVAAHDLKVGDKLLSADVESFPYDNLAATNMDLINWTSENPYVNLVETEIVGLRYRTSKWAVIVDSDIFSDTHYIMVKRGEVTSFVKALDLEHTDLIWSYSERNWISISILEKVDVNHEVVSIDCEPYDIFFTERMLTHDSNTVD